MGEGQKLTREYQLGKRIARRLNEGIRDFSLIAPGDHLLIGLSGGKDSLALLELLAEYRRRSPVDFSLSALHVRMENVDYLSDTDYLESIARSAGVPLRVKTGRFEADRNSRRTPCFLCSWNRRKLLFETARELGCNKIALGHHQDDILQTALMNQTFNGTFSTMPVRMRMQKFPMTIVRPLCRVAEADLREWAELRGYRKQTKICPFNTASNRTSIKQIFRDMEALNPDVRYSLWHALQKEGKLTED